MVEYVPHKNRIMDFFGFGTYRCKKHGDDVSSEPFQTCWSCYRDDFQARAEMEVENQKREREARVGEMTEAIIRAKREIDGAVDKRNQGT